MEPNRDANAEANSDEEDGDDLGFGIDHNFRGPVILDNDYDPKSLIH